jgi:transcriptional regulator with XRE-family HTH domain
MSTTARTRLLLQTVRFHSPIALGEVVRAHRKDQGMRIDDAASLMGVSVDLLSSLENGKRSVRIDKLQIVLDALGLSLAIVPKNDPAALAMIDAEDLVASDAGQHSKASQP